MPLVETLLGNALLVPLTLLTLLVFAAVLRRLLGVRVGLVRTALAAVLAFLLAGPLLDAMLPSSETDIGTALLLGLLAVSVASLLAMIVLVIAEVLVPDGSLPGPIELWRGWRTRVARSRRYTQILAIALRHGLGRFLRGRQPTGLESSSSRRQLARSLRRALDEGGVTFVKVGQQLSTRRDLIPVEFADELTQLQDQAASISWAEVTAVLTAELGQPVEEVFATVDSRPLAAASVAQVHAARLPDGRDVVVKVQRPDIARVVERDLDILLRLARTVEARTSWGRSVGLQHLAAGFAEALREELDFTIERDNMRGVAGAQDGARSHDVLVPAPIDGLCTRRVLVMERLTGTPLGSAERVLVGLGPDRRREIATALLESVLDQLLVHGLFHADLHPGNVLVQDDGALGLLDFGSVGRIDGTTRRAIGRLLAALNRGDSATATDALLELVNRPDQVDERELERSVGVLVVRYASPGAATGAAAFSALFRLVTSHRLGVPPQVAAIFRTFATLEGTLSAIDPQFDLVARAREVGGELLTEAMDPARLRQSLEDELASLLPLLRRLPRRVERIADAVEHGRLSVNVRLFADDRDRRVATSMLHQTLLAGLGAAAGLMAVLLLGTEGGPDVTGAIELFSLLGYALFIVSVVLVLRVLVIIFRRDPD